ncbi:MAG TPA: DUF507 family protein [Candidatus Methanoperedens sp.]|nr:DUF507 family protein [Candidatus Methanoperedens sp.]
MKLSDDRINHLSHVLFRAVNALDEVDFMEEENEVRLRIKQVLVECLRQFDGIDEKIQATLGSYSRKIVEGSREWDVMWSKAYDEEIRKLRAV